MSSELRIPQEWTAAERWAWGEIRAGRIADFNERYSDALDPKTPYPYRADSLESSRTLSPSFLVTVLTEESFVRATPYTGVRIAGANFDASIHLGHARLERQLRLSGCRFSGALRLEGIHINGWFSLEGSWMGGPVTLASANIRGCMDLDASTFNDSLDMGAIEIGRSLFMQRGARFNQVDLRMAEIGGEIRTNGSAFDSLDMRAIQVGQYVLMQGARFKQVDLRSAKIGLSLRMEGSTFEEELSLDLIQVSTVCWAESASFPPNQTVHMRAARLGALNLTQAQITSMDLTDTTIHGTLLLDGTKWRKGSKMRLRNTTVGAIQDGPTQEESWPRSLELEGFAYARLGGWDAPAAADLAGRDEDWFINWLERDKTSSPQPYEQLASVLRRSGSPAKANAILYAARQRSRRAAWERGEQFRWFGLLLLEATIGYGLGVRYLRVLWWFGGFTLVGFLLLLSAPQLAFTDHFTLAWASFNNILPFVTLNPNYNQLLLDAGSQLITAYFYVQHLIGYVLGGFLGAGLAGLTQSET